MEDEKITLVEDAIHNPNEPRHFMVIEKICAVTATVRGANVGCTDRAFKIKEVGKKIHNPVIYFPRDTVEEELLEKSDMTTQCPLKGTATYYHIKVGKHFLENAAWSYEDILSHDDRLEKIKDAIAFDPEYTHVTEIKG